MKLKIFLLIIFIQGCFQFGFSIDNDTIKSTKSILYEKVYLHIDRELNAPGHYIQVTWYAVNRINNKQAQVYNTIYVQLISDKSRITDTRPSGNRGLSRKLTSCSLIFCSKKGRKARVIS